MFFSNPPPLSYYLFPAVILCTLSRKSFHAFASRFMKALGHILCLGSLLMFTLSVYLNFSPTYICSLPRSVVIRAPCYKPEGRWFMTR
jgi:hypothetical protein